MCHFYMVRNGIVLQVFHLLVHVPNKHPMTSEYFVPHSVGYHVKDLLREFHDTKCVTNLQKNPLSFFVDKKEI